ncbi:MAG: PH domain-containing protein [Ardenticatenales bacterium]|nr:PH domain-containing protein [Ardenticatenales bacterium]
MSPLIIRPSQKLRAKYRLLTWLWLGLIGLGTMLFAFVIGLDTAGYSGAMTGLFIALLLNLLWFLPALWLVDRYFESIRYELHEDEIIVQVGIWTHSVKHVPFRTITNIAIKRDILDRYLFHIGTLEVQTAGFSASQSGAEETLAGLVDYEGIYGMVADALRRYRTLPMSPAQSGPDTLPTNPTDLSALLDEVRAIRTLLAAREGGG